MFYTYQKLWSIAVKSNMVNGEVKIFEMSSSLSTRLEYYVRTYDKFCIECLKTSNNDTSVYMHYYFNYMIILITGTFDNLAWIISELYDLKLNRMKIVLKKNDNEMNGNKDSAFIKSLRMVDSNFS